MKLSYALLFVLLLGCPVFAANYKMTGIDPVPIRPETNVYLHIALENTGPDATLVRVDVESTNSGIRVTDRLYYVGAFPTDSSIIAPIGIHVGDITAGDYDMKLLVYDSNGVHTGTFKLPIGTNGTFTSIELGTAYSSGGSSSSSTSSKADWSCGQQDFEVKNIAYRGEDDARIDPTDKIELVVYLKSLTTDKIRDVQAELEESILGLTIPNRKYNYVDIDGREEKAGYFVLTTEDLTPGSYSIDMKAEYVKGATVCKAKLPINLTVSGGYGVRVEATPDTADVNPAGEKSIKVNIKNNGDADDVYKLYFSGASNWVQQHDAAISVPKGESRDTFVKLYVPMVTGMYDLVIGAESRTLSTVRDEDRVILISKAQKIGAHAISLSFNKHSADVAPGKSVTFGLKVQNVGNTKDAVALAVVGPSWALLNPSTIELESGAIKELELYAAPDANAAMGSHEITVKASTFGGEATAEEKVAVYVTETPATPPVAAGDSTAVAAAATGWAILDFSKRSGLMSVILFQAALIAALVLAVIRKTERPEAVVN